MTPATNAGTDEPGVELIMATLYLLEQYSVVKLEGEALRVQIPAARDGSSAARMARVPLIKVDQVVVVGEITLTASAMQALLQERKAIHFLTAHGRSLGSLLPDPSKNAAMHIAQARAADTIGQRFELARRCVVGKLDNMRITLLRYQRSRALPALEIAIDQLHAMRRQIRLLTAPTTVATDDRMQGLGPLLGLEGAGSAAYFGVFDALLRPPWTFPGRVRRPPTDPVNALLSFGYTVLTNQITSMLCTVGLNPHIGLLHRPGYGKPALALDLLEEFRPVIVDSVVLTMLNGSQLDTNDFSEELGAYRLKDDARKRFLAKLEARLDEVVQHPFFNYRTSYRRCIELQARLLAKHLLGEVAEYKPFVVR